MMIMCLARDDGFVYFYKFIEINNLRAVNVKCVRNTGTRMVDDGFCFIYFHLCVCYGSAVFISR